MQDEKNRLAQLRQQRKESIERAREAMKEQARLVRAIKDQLQQGAMTVPELARAIGEESARVLLFVSGLRKYGEVVEGEKIDGYFAYRLAATDGGER